MIKFVNYASLVLMQALMQEQEAWTEAAMYNHDYYWLLLNKN